MRPHRENRASPGNKLSMLFWSTFNVWIPARTTRSSIHSKFFLKARRLTSLGSQPCSSSSELLANDSNKSAPHKNRSFTLSRQIFGGGRQRETNRDKISHKTPAKSKQQTSWKLLCSNLLKAGKYLGSNSPPSLAGFPVRNSEKNKGTIT